MSREYEVIIEAASASLADDEWWCVFHPDGPLTDTKSKRMDTPVIIACEALGADWGDLQDQGWRIDKFREGATP